MSIHFQITDQDGTSYSLNNYTINFGRMARGLVTKRKVTLSNVGFTVQGVELECIPHPTHQVGLPGDTYNVTELSTSEDGTYVKVLQLASLPPNIQTDIWIRWSVPVDGLPGAGKFAIQAKGKVIWT